MVLYLGFPYCICLQASQTWLALVIKVKAFECEKINLTGMRKFHKLSWEVPKVNANDSELAFPSEIIFIEYSTRDYACIYSLK